MPPIVFQVRVTGEAELSPFSDSPPVKGLTSPQMVARFDIVLRKALLSTFAPVVRVLELLSANTATQIYAHHDPVRIFSDRRLAVGMESSVPTGASPITTAMPQQRAAEAGAVVGEAVRCGRWPGRGGPPSRAC